jgi:hypothetical protein
LRVRRAPWRLLLLPFVILSMLAYVAKLIDRGRLKEINHRCCSGTSAIHPRELKPLVDSFADGRRWPTMSARRAQGDRARQGRRAARGDGDRQLPPLRRAIAERLGFDDVHRHQFDHRPRRAGPRQDRRRELLRPGQAADDRGLARARAA